MDAWQVLGLAPTDDLRALKRAYAACLKRCRPEDDAEGFARLRGAYEYLLAQLGAAGASRASEPVAARVVEIAPPAGTGLPVAPNEAAAPMRSSAQPSVPVPRGPQQIAADVLTQACQVQGHDSTVAFAAWLAMNPELMRLDGKPLISRLVLARILRGQTPTPQAFDKLEAFFHWGDRVEQRRLEQAGLQVESARVEVRTAQLRRELVRGVARKWPLERRLDAVRRAGTGWHAWWLALVGRAPHTAPQLLHGAIEQHGYRAVEQVFGAEVLAFWQRATSPRPTCMQWIIGLAQAVLIGVLLALVGVILGGLGMLLSIGHGDQAMHKAFATPVAIMGVIGLVLTMLVAVPRILHLAIRWLVLGPMPRVLAAWHALREHCALDRQWRSALPATAVLLGLGWYWPTSVSPLPLLAGITVLLLLHLRDVRSVIGLVFVAIGALPLCVLHGTAQPLAASLLPPSLWLGHAIHAFLQRRPRGPRLTRGTVVMVVGLILATTMLALSGWLGGL